MADLPSRIDQIKLAGRTYGLDIPGAVLYREPAHRKFPQRQFETQGEQQFWKEWTMSSWHGGERLRRILTEDDLKSFRYHDAEGLDEALLAKWGELKLAPALVRSLEVSSANLPMTVSSDGSKLILGLTVSPYVKVWTYTGGWQDATSVPGSGAVTDLITAGSSFYAVRGGAVLSSTDGFTWTEVGSYTTAVGLAYVNGDLWIGKSDGVYNHTDNEEITTIGCTCIAGYRENVYFGSDRRIYRYDGRATYLYDELPLGFVVNVLIPYRQVLLILGHYKVRTGYKGAVYYIVNGAENHLYSIGDYSADHRIYACAGSDDEIFFANPKRGGADRYDLEVGGLSNGPCWGEAGHIPFKAMAVCEGYLFVGRYDNDTATDGVYVADIQSPSGWNTTGWLSTSEYDFGWSNDAKLFGSIYIEHVALKADESIRVEYSLDGGTTYYIAGTSNTPGATSKSFTLNNVVGYAIKLKFTLSGPGTSTPTLTKAVVKATALADAKWAWDLRLLITRKWGGEDAIEDLQKAYQRRSLLDFTDRDGRSYKVVIENMTIDADPDPEKAAAHVTLRLREV